jgi:gluconate 2-dehydrogenase subunit 3-like protein
MIQFPTNRLNNMTVTRRNFIKQGGLALGFTLAGSRILLTPAEAHAQNIPFVVFTDAEVEILEAVCEIILPGARQAGVANFVDHQLGVDANDSLLILKYFNYPPPYADFYRAALKELGILCRNLFNKTVGELDTVQGKKFIEAIRDADTPDWKGPPPPLVYHAMRNDAVDVVYGTVEGFKKLGVPYAEHILPPEGWS